MKIEAILCGSVKQLKILAQTQRNKLEPTLVLALVYLAKWRPNYFDTELIVEALLSLLKRDVSVAVGPFKGRIPASVSCLACNLLLAGCEDTLNWPESFLKVFIDDSIGERVWVDRDECQGFVDNMLTAFNTKIANKNLFQPDNPAGSGSAAASSPSIPSLGLAGSVEDEGSVDSDNSQGGLLRGSSHPAQQDVKEID